MNEKCSGCEDLKDHKKDCDKLSWRQLLVAFGAAIVAVVLLIELSGYRPVRAEQACYTKEQVTSATVSLKKCLTIYNGGVYDFTLAKKWDISGHVGKHLCGKEYDKETIEQGPHSVAVMAPFKVGTLCGVFNTSPKTISGMSWLQFTSYLSLLFFVLNFSTCYAMPWAKVKEPWKGSRPGKDKNDLLGSFPLTHMHKIWAWLAVFALTLHGLIGFSRVLLGKWF